MGGEDTRKTLLLLAGTASGARAMPPGGYFYTQQSWEQAVCSQNRCKLHASHTECDTGCSDRAGGWRCIVKIGVRRDGLLGGRQLRLGLGQLDPHKPLQGSC